MENSENMEKNDFAVDVDQVNVGYVNSSTFPQLLMSEESDDEFRNRTPSGTLLSESVNDIKKRLMKRLNLNKNEGSRSNSGSEEKMDSQSDQSGVTESLNGQPESTQPKKRKRQAKATVRKLRSKAVKGHLGAIDRYLEQNKQKNLHSQNEESDIDNSGHSTDSSRQSNEGFSTPKEKIDQSEKDELKMLHQLAPTLHELTQQEIEQSQRQVKEAQKKVLEERAIKAAASDPVNIPELKQGLPSHQPMCDMEVEATEKAESGHFGMQTIHEMFSQLKDEFQSMKKELVELRSQKPGVNEKEVTESIKKQVVEEVAQSIGEFYERDSDQIDKVKQDLKHFKFRNRALVNMVQSMHTEIEDLKARMDNVELNNVRAALSISGLEISDKKREGIQQLQEFIDYHLGVIVTIEDFFKVGDNPKLIVFFLQTMQQKRDILHFKSYLKTARNSHGKKYYINNYIPAAAQEKKKKDSGIRERAEKLGLETTYIKGKLAVRGQTFSSRIVPPTPKQVVDLQPKDLQRILDREIQQTGRVSQDNSIFEAYTASVNSFTEIRDLYVKVKLMQPMARHVVCAYWIEGEGDQIQYSQDYCDDGEISAGRKLLDFMIQNDLKCRVLFVARKYGGVRMGPSRFECYTSAAHIVIQANSWNKKLKAHQAVKERSQEQTRRNESNPPGGDSRQDKDALPNFKEKPDQHNAQRYRGSHNRGWQPRRPYGNNPRRASRGSYIQRQLNRARGSYHGYHPSENYSYERWSSYDDGRFEDRDSVQ